MYYILVRLQTPSYYRKSTEVLLKSTHLCVNVCGEGRGGELVFNAEPGTKVLSRQVERGGESSG